MNNIVIEDSKSKIKTLKINDIYIHSKYKPIEEANRWTDSVIKEIGKNNIIFVIGLGLTYHIESLINRLEEHSHLKYNLFIIEPENELIDVAKENNPAFFEKIRNNDRIKCKIIWNILEIENEITKSLNQIAIEDLGGFKSFSLRGWNQAYPELSREIENIITNSIKGFLSNRFTSIELQRLWFKHFTINLSLLSPKASINDVEIKNPDTVTIISAGTSLRDSLEILKKYQHKIYIICVDTALSALLQKGIKPDIVVSLDTQFHNYKDFFSIKEYEIYNNEITNFITACDLTVYPRIITSNRNTVSFITNNDSSSYLDFIKLFENFTKTHSKKINCGGSVSTSALDIALDIGFRKTILIGQDLAYLSGATHSAGSPSYNNNLYNSNKLSSMISKTHSFYNNRKIQGQKTNKNTFIYRDLSMTNLHNWINEYIEIHINKSEFYQLNSVGVSIANCKQINNKQFIEIIEDLNNKEDINISRNNSYLQNNKNNIKNYYSRIVNELSLFKTLLDDLFNKNLTEDVYIDESVINEILEKRKQLFDNFPILRIFYEKDDLYFNRIGKDKGDYFSYISLIRTSTFQIIRIIQRALAF